MNVLINYRQSACGFEASMWITEQLNRAGVVVQVRGGAPIGVGGHDPHFSRQRGTGDIIRE